MKKNMCYNPRYRYIGKHVSASLQTFGLKYVLKNLAEHIMH